jgi:hypothetical protein
VRKGGEFGGSNRKEGRKKIRRVVNGDLGATGTKGE